MSSRKLCQRDPYKFGQCH